MKRAGEPEAAPATRHPFSPLGWRLFALVAMLALTVPRMLQRGMFLDGITYAVIARNLSIGTGSMWAPSFSATTYNVFYEQPPLGFVLQAIPFRLFGDHFAIERVYAVTMFLATAALAAGIWRRVIRADFDWLPLLFWLLPSVVTWAVVNNMLEVSQATATTLACFALMQTARRPFVIAETWAGVAGLCVIAAVLIKGPVGLFPLALPIAMRILPRDRRPSRPLATWAMFYGVVAAGILALGWYEPSRRLLIEFNRTHLAPALSGERGTGPWLRDFLRHLAVGIWLRMAVIAAVIWLIRRRRGFRVSREAMFFLVVGCLASLPLLATPVLAGHYLLASMIFFALGFAALVLPALEPVSPVSQVAVRVPYVLTSIVIVVTAGVLAVHGPVEIRSAEAVRSMDAIRDVAPVNQTVGACASSAVDWGLQAFFQRFYRISLDPSDAPHQWFVQAPGGCSPPPECVTPTRTESFVLWHCRR